jgi:hypothetical protein
MDTFAIALVGISSALAVLIVFLLLGRGNTPQPGATPPQTQQTVVSIDPSVAGTTTAVAFATETANLPFITPEEALQLHQTGAAKFIDVRLPESYAQKHIKGAVNVPQKDTFTNPKEFPKEGNLIVYCQ